MTSRGCCVLVYDSSGEPAGRPGCSRVFFLGPCGSQFEVGGATSEDEVRKGASRRSGLMDTLDSRFSSHIFHFLRSYVFMFWHSLPF